ncbi:hypothetical protein SteCoe_22205 [Stentor coeruleus]|uniref:Amidohydrolase-related domain-containing protein n=1 Tax=Stentor coeruleus TaxID=5963 RepID=A0A1R2BMP8_9CILI|nr:hypothetical protein SteCoe_22205 [Stentor coeruleus]
MSYSNSSFAIIADKVFTGLKTLQKSLVFIENGIIIEITELPKILTVNEIKNLYANWSIIYIPDTYMIPGITDLNIRATFECEECLSTAAYMGGITQGYVEVTTYTVFTKKNLRPLQVISHHDELYSGTDIVKIYLSQPDCYTPHTEDVAEIITEANELGRSVVIDCSINDPRLLAMASPFRTEPELKRLVGKVTNLKIFASAIEVNVCETSSNSSEDEKVLENTVETIENPLIEAELRTYKASGKTVYNEKEQSRCRRPQALVIPIIRQETGYDNYLHNIPRSWELRGVKLALETVAGPMTPPASRSREKSYVNCSQIHFSNIACAETIEYLWDYAGRLPCVTWETSPNYLLFNENHLTSALTNLKTYPPIRDKRNQESLCKLYLDNKIHCIGSHHTLVRPEFKVKEFARAVPGICNLGYGICAIWTLLPNKDDNDIQHLVMTMCVNPARIAKIDWEIKVGNPATFVLWNPFVERKACIYQQSPYKDRKLCGEVIQVFIRGENVYNVDNV